METRELLDSIETDASGGLRDRTLMSRLLLRPHRRRAHLKVDDYFPEGKRWNLRLHEKGGTEHVVPVHHTLEEYLDAYLAAAGLRRDPKGDLFRSLALGPGRPLSARPLAQSEAWRMIRRWAAGPTFNV